MPGSGGGEEVGHPLFVPHFLLSPEEVAAATGVEGPVGRAVGCSEQNLIQCYERPSRRGGTAVSPGRSRRRSPGYAGFTNPEPACSRRQKICAVPEGLGLTKHRPPSIPRQKKALHAGLSCFVPQSGTRAFADHDHRFQETASAGLGRSRITTIASKKRRPWDSGDRAARSPIRNSSFAHRSYHPSR